jgi:hypothetical protein
MISRRISEADGTDDDAQEDLQTQHMDGNDETIATPINIAGSQSINLKEELWGILRIISTHKEFRLVHRVKDNVRDHYTVGRSKACDIVIPDKRVSSIHCAVYCDYELGRLRVFVEDSSANGTFVNGTSTRLKRNQRTELKSGDEIYVVNPDLPSSSSEAVGPFLFINMRDRIVVQKKVMPAPAPVLRRSSRTGRHIEDEYLVGEQLGSGMCGQVHRCIHRKTNQQFAVKIINTKKFSLSPGLSPSELREEAEIMKHLNHVSKCRKFTTLQCTLLTVGVFHEQPHIIRIQVRTCVPIADDYNSHGFYSGYI